VLEARYNLYTNSLIVSLQKPPLPLKWNVLYKYDLIYTYPSNNAILPSLAGVPSSFHELECFSECCLDTIKVLIVKFTLDVHVVYSEIDDPISYLQY
jgi:hypothetical protein